MFDECHKAKNATSTKMGKAVLDLQHKLPLARVVYASATGGPFSHCTCTSVFHYRSFSQCLYFRTVCLPVPLSVFLLYLIHSLSVPVFLSISLGLLVILVLFLALSLYHYLTLLLCHPSGASEPKNMIYMSRLGIWGDGTPFKTFDDFLHAIEKRSGLIPHALFLIYITILLLKCILLSML